MQTFHSVKGATIVNSGLPLIPPGTRRNPCKWPRPTVSELSLAT